MKNSKNTYNLSIENIKSKIIHFFDLNNDIVSVYLFGSIVTNRLNDESDIDIAIILKNSKEYKIPDKIQIREELSELLGRDVDVVYLNDAPVILRMQVFRKGIKLFDRNPNVTNTLIVKSQFEYDDLKYIRSPIERQILRGRVYG